MEHRIELLLLVAGILLAACVLASRASAKIRVPALLLFIALGMLAGSEGLGGIYFDDYRFARSLGIVSLVLILFAGGLDTSWTNVWPVVGAGVSLASVGVLATAAIVAGFAWLFLDLSPLIAVLLGAIVSPTDAAAVFGVLRGQGVRLKKRLIPLLEFESGTNDPMAVFLTIGVTHLILNPEIPFWTLIPSFFQQMAIGALLGLLLGKATAWFINRVRLEYDGLYAAVTVSLACLSYGGTTLVGGNGFLAVYLAGLVLGRHNFLHRINLIQFHDGLAWLLQMAVFVTLGLLVFPSRLVQVSLAGLALALFLAFVARPIAVFAALAFTRAFSWREKLFVSWVGLRGAVPVILATLPLTDGVPGASYMFNVVFFVVLVSVLLQGTTLTEMARALHLLVDREDRLIERRVASNLWEILLTPESPAIGRQVVELNMPKSALIVLLMRGEESYIPRGATVFEAGDRILIATRKTDIHELKMLFLGARDGGAAEVQLPKNGAAHSSAAS